MSYKTKCMEKVLEVLLGIKSGKIDVRKENTGICNIIFKELPADGWYLQKSFLDVVFHKWLVSKNILPNCLNLHFPVELRREYYMEAVKNKTLWDNLVRWELLDYMINYVQKELDLNKPL